MTQKVVLQIMGNVRRIANIDSNHNVNAATNVSNKGVYNALQTFADAEKHNSWNE
jgi:hypothetical protein